MQYDRGVRPEGGWNERGPRRPEGRQQAPPPGSLKPKSPAFYTGNPYIYDLIDFLVDARDHYEAEARLRDPDFTPVPTPKKVFLGREKLAYNLNMPISLPLYDLLVKHLAALDAFSSMLPPRLRDELEQCKIDISERNAAASGSAIDRLGMRVNHGGVEMNTGGVPPVDQYGRSVGKGGRKEARARVWCIDGPGMVFINGRTLPDYFPRLSHRESVLFPLQAADVLGQFNVWAVVFGGGHSGQAEAVQNGLAKALAYQNSQRFGPVLDKLGLLKRDPRSVERKKPGQLKARKKFPWVKR